MKLIQCPDDRVVYYEEKSIFLGGSISGAGNWQKEMVDLLKDTELTVVNPRRDDFDINDPTMSVKQIEWEFDKLHQVKAILFWFSFETVAPITLYELAAHLIRSYHQVNCYPTKIFVGVHPQYKRKLDVEVQLRLAADWYGKKQPKIVYDLDSLAQEVICWSENN